MTPGLARGPPFPDLAKKGAIVAVATSESPSVPLFVGVCEIDVSGLTHVQGAKGHAVRSFHWEGDELWAWSQTGRGGSQPPESIEGWDDDDDDSLEEGVRNLEVDDDEEDGQDGGVSLGVADNSGTKAGQDDNVDQEDDHEPSTAEIDSTFRGAFIYALYDAKQKQPSHPTHGISFPIPPSLVVSNYVQPYLPIFTPKQSTYYTLKKTSWKNIRKFIKYLDKEMLVKSKDRDKHETVILDVDFNDRAVVNFTPYKLPKKEGVGADDGGAGGGKPATITESSSDPSVGQELSLDITYRPSQKISAIFPANASPSPHGPYFDAVSLRSTLDKYLDTNRLIDSSNRRLVQLDPILSNSVFSDSATEDKIILANGNITRDALLHRIITDTHLCAPYYVLYPARQDPSSIKPSPGSPPKVTITLETRSGNKTVTKVSGVEKFNINPNLLADELQKKCASSVSVNALVGGAVSKGKVPQEVLIQGSQKGPVEEALERRGVRGSSGKGKGKGNVGAWVEVVDKTKGKGKGRR